MNLELARPWWLLLLPLVALLAWYLRRHVNHANPWRGICDAPLLQFLTQERRTATRSSGPWILGVALLMAILALAGPGRSNQRPAAFRAATVRIVVLDVSRSMNATDLGASRLDLARFKAIDLLERTQDGQSAVILYAGDAFLLAPPSDDSITLSTLLRVVDSSVMPVRGSRLERALTMAGELAARPAVDFAEVVVLTDGASAAAVAAATRLREAGTRVSVIGVGTLAGAPVPSSPRGFLRHDGTLVISRLDEPALGAVAAAGGGHYVRLSSTDRDIDRLTENLTAAPNHALIRASESLRFEDLGYWFVVALLPLAALGFRRGWLLGAAGAALLVGPVVSVTPAQALSWEELWRRPDQISAAAIRRGDYARAAEYAIDPWQLGVALYRGGRLAQAAAAFSSWDSAEASYNLGNALAKSGQLEGAVAAYEQSLRQDPNHTNARFNLSLVVSVLHSQHSAGAARPRQTNQSAPATSTSPGQGSKVSTGDARPTKTQAATAGRTAGDARQGSQPPSSGPQSDRVEHETADTTSPRLATSETNRESIRPPTSASQSAQHPALVSGKARGTPERRRALRELLRKVADDPAGLLRQKFLLQHQSRPSPQVDSDEPW